MKPETSKLPPRSKESLCLGIFPDFLLINTVFGLLAEEGRLVL
jgi:hypothetical protein